MSNEGPPEAGAVAGTSPCAGVETAAWGCRCHVGIPEASYHVGHVSRKVRTFRRTYRDVATGRARVLVETRRVWPPFARCQFAPHIGARPELPTPLRYGVLRERLGARRARPLRGSACSYAAFRCAVLQPEGLDSFSPMLQRRAEHGQLYARGERGKFSVSKLVYNPTSNYILARRFVATERRPAINEER
jgi:hypothetical protein